MIFYDRKSAGHAVAEKLSSFRNKPETIVLGLARGGVIVAAEVAMELHLPLNVVVPRKIGAPSNPELALGAIMEEGEGVFNTSIIQALEVPKSYIDHEIEKERGKARQRLALYRQYAPLPNVEGWVVILVDDGIATGSTMLAAIQAMRQAKAKKVVVAAPVSSLEAYEVVSDAADEVFCVEVRKDFSGVGMCYHHFEQIEDLEVVQVIKLCAQGGAVL